MAAMLEEQNNEIYSGIKIKLFFPVEKNSIVFSFSMATANTLFLIIKKIKIKKIPPSKLFFRTVLAKQKKTDNTSTK